MNWQIERSKMWENEAHRILSNTFFRQIGPGQRKGNISCLQSHGHYTSHNSVLLLMDRLLLISDCDRQQTFIRSNAQCNDLIERQPYASGSNQPSFFHDIVIRFTLII